MTNPFLDPSATPTDESLKRELGRAYKAFDQLMSSIVSVKPEWKFYNAKTGWTLKAIGKKRAAFYVSPKSGEFALGMTVNAKDREALLANDSIPESIRTPLQTEKKIMEGFPIQRTVRTLKDLQPLLVVLKALDRL
ncbi:DUF3788 domain-containing protein [bacterium]|nr:DUF3788 domain-containing protein [bacterium]